MNDLDKANQISNFYAKYAKEHFMVSKIASKLESILRQL